MKKGLFGLFILNSLLSNAQDKSGKISAEIGLITSATAAYRINGTDTALKNALTLAPYIKVINRKGLGLSYSINSLVSATGKHVFMQTAGAFYEEYSKPLNINLSYTHFFFSGNNAIPYSRITNEVYTYFAYKKLMLAPLFSASFGFGNDETNNFHSSLNLAAGVTHSFSFRTKSIDEAEITPSLLVNVGNDEFYSFLKNVRYLAQNVGKKGFLKSHGQGKSGNGNGGNNSNTSSAKFTLNNIELNLYSGFTMGDFKITPDMSAYFPTNADGQLSGYWQLTFAYLFGKK